MVIKGVCCVLPMYLWKKFIIDFALQMFVLHQSRGNEWNWTCWGHYSDVIMSTIRSQITSLTVVYSTVYSDTDQRKHQSSASLVCAGNSPGTGEFPAQLASNAENVFIWWRLHVQVTHICQQTKPFLLQIMASSLFSAKPVSVPMLAHC